MKVVHYLCSIQTQNDMKTLGLEIFEINETKNGVQVDYCIFDAESQEDKLELIPHDTLETYIIDNDLNLEEFTNWKHVSLECDGLDQRFIPAHEYLSENLNKVVWDYLESNLNQVA